MSNAESVLTALRKHGPLKLAEIVAVTSLPERAVDSALQRLRRAETVRFDTKAGWSAVYSGSP